MPALRQLSVAVRLEGTLPAEWAQGLLQLDTLNMYVPFSSGCGMHMASHLVRVPLPRDSTPPVSCPNGQQDSNATLVHLPVEWAAGFPRLEALSLSGLPVLGTLPASWADGGFPSLKHWCVLWFAACRSLKGMEGLVMWSTLQRLQCPRMEHNVCWPSLGIEPASSSPA